MKKVTKRWLSVLLAVLMMMSTVAVSFAASGATVGQVKNVKLVSVLQTQVKIKWSKVKNASGYCVLSYDSQKEKWNAETYTTSLAFTDKGLAAGTKYTYKVRAYIKDGSTRIYGKDSAKVSALTKPARVEKVTAKALNPAKIKLSWDAAQGATGYLIYAKNSSGSYAKVASTKKRSYTIDYDAAPGLMYFKVRTYAKVGSLKQYAKSFSPVAKVKTKPEKVESLTATNIEGTSATLKWKASAGASDYLVLKKDLSTGDEYVQTAVVKQNSYDIKYDVSPGQTFYRVQASATVDGNTTLSSASTPIGIYFKPKGVTALNAKTIGANSITLEWPAADGASEYRVYRYISGELTEIGRTENTTFVAKGLEPETTYVFHVRAFAQFAQQELTTPFSPVLRVDTCFGEIKGFDYVLNSNNTAFLSWNLLPGAEGYEIEKNGSAGWQKIGESDTTMFDVSALEPDEKLGVGRTYEYRVRAYMTEDEQPIYSAYTEVAEIHSIPGKVNSLKLASGSDHSIVLDWTAVDGADAYHIQFYSEDGKWVDYFTVPGNSYIEAGGGNRVGFQDIGIEESGTYQYRVAPAVLNAGRWTFGAYSDVASIDYKYEAEPESDYVPGLNRSGILGYLYDPREDVFYTAEDPWQRNFGFNPVYDLASQFVWIQYDTIRFRFTYQGDDWMIQPWKGQYGAVLYGAEIGVYKKYTERDADHYDCAKDEDRLLMSMELERYYPDEEGTGGQWQHEFSRPYGTYWWCTGFKLGWIRFTSPGQAIVDETYPDLRANFRVTMKDFEMLQVFTASLREQGYKETNLTKPGNKQYSVKGLDVYFPF